MAVRPVHPAVLVIAVRSAVEVRAVRVAMHMAVVVIVTPRSVHLAVLVMPMAIAIEMAAIGIAMHVSVMVAMPVVAIHVLRVMHKAISCRHGRQRRGLRGCCERQRKTGGQDCQDLLARHHLYSVGTSIFMPAIPGACTMHSRFRVKAT